MDFQFIFLALLIPLFTAIILWFWFKHKTAWWEFLIPFAASIIIILIFKFIAEFSKKTDTVTKKTVKEIMGKFVINVMDRWKCKFPTDAMDNTTIIFVKFKPDFFT